MAIAEKQMGGGLMDLLPLLLGEKTKTGSTSTTTSNANTAPLQQVFNSAQPLDAASYEAMISAAFAEAAKQIPELTTALANATGSRSSSNSALALGINDANRRAADAAVTQRLQYNQNQQQIAGNAAKGIADSTRSQSTASNQTQKQGTATNPLIPLVGGFALNQFDKRGGMDALGRVGSGIVDSIGSFFNPTNDIVSNIGSEWDMAPPAGFDMGFGGGSNFTAGDSGFDWGSATAGVGDFVGGIGDTLGGWADTAGDWLGDAFSSAGDFFGFADGGMPGSYRAGGYGPPCGPQMRGTAPLARGWDGFYASGMQNPTHAPVMRAWNPTPRSGGYANGGPVGGGMIPARAAAPMAVADRAAMGGDANMMMQQILQQAMMPQQQMAPSPNPINFLRYLLPTSGFNIYQYADGGMAGRRPGYADGGVVRNRNNMGAAPTRQGTGAVTVNASGGRPNPNSGAGGNGVGSEALGQMVKEMVSLLDTGRTAGLGGQEGAVRGNADSAGGAINSAAGNPLGRSVAEGLVGTMAGMASPDALGQLSQVANPAVGAVTGVPVGPMSLVRAMLQAARNENQATGDIDAAPDPLGAFVGALNAVNPSLGINTSDIGMTNAVAAANAASAVTGVDGITALSTVTNNFTTPTMPGMPGFNSALGGWSGGLTGAPNTGSAGFGEGADGDAAGMNGESGSFASGGYGESDSGSLGGDSDGGNSGGGGASSGGGSFGGGTGGMGDANGGLLKGPGTGTSDSIPARSRVPGEHSTRFSNGEFIMSRDAVEFYGPQFFQDLLMKAHAPVRR